MYSPLAVWYSEKYSTVLTDVCKLSTKSIVAGIQDSLSGLKGSNILVQYEPYFEIFSNTLYDKNFINKYQQAKFRPVAATC